MFPPEFKIQLSKGLHTVLKMVENSIFRIKIISRLVEFYWELFGSNRYNMGKVSKVGSIQMLVTPFYFFQVDE